MTERLYYQDCYLREFRAQVVETSADGLRVYLDRTAFYPTSGGQLFDIGILGGANVTDVVDEGERVAHVADSPLPLGEVSGEIDWVRRFDHMQQHSGQHLLSAVLAELFQMPTVSVHLGAEISTIDLGSPVLTPARIEQAEERCAEIVSQARPIAIVFEEAGADLGLRKASERTGTLRVVSIDGVDRSACGGTHVKTTAEVGPVLVRKLDKMRGNVRLEFVCGLRALRQARADFRTLQEISRVVSVPASDAPALIATQIGRLKAVEKDAQRLAGELALREGKELWGAAAPDPEGIRRVTVRGSMDDAVRTRAQAFCSQGRAVFLAISREPPALLLAASADSGVHAGERVKAAVTAAGGRGGGNQALAQGSLPAGTDVDAIARTVLLT
ncbi:MAG: alanyl-tRNA editing protein [Bryobacterales bacterium]|nr:alanyl-tRNA editing protein [Bryobacterales bacterium]